MTDHKVTKYGSLSLTLHGSNPCSFSVSAKLYTFSTKPGDGDGAFYEATGRGLRPKSGKRYSAAGLRHVIAAESWVMAAQPDTSGMLLESCSGCLVHSL